MSEIQLGLLITVIGMGLVFVVITFLWGLMALILRLTTNKEEVINQAGVTPGAIETQVPERLIVEGQRKAAAAAVAVTTAISDSEFRSSQQRGWGLTETLSPWQNFHRARQLEDQQKRG
jgi:Na+-transporting methylmalonyl-CoA/oxaloacetate decarboxylase gamma subunit